MLKAILSPFADKAYAVLRIVTGFLLAFAGAMKLFNFFIPPGMAPKAGSQLWIGALIELVAGAGIAIGLFTRCSAFVCSGMMAVAYWQFHVVMNVGQAQGIARFIPSANGGVPAAVLCFVYLYVACKGPGVWSIDAKREAAAAGS